MGAEKLKFQLTGNIFQLAKYVLPKKYILLTFYCNVPGENYSKIINFSWNSNFQLTRLPRLPVFCRHGLGCVRKLGTKITLKIAIFG